MIKTYRVLAWVIVGLVVLQAVAIGYAEFGVTKYISDGAVVNASNINDLTFDGVVGFIVHWLNGLFLIPLVALALLVISFFAKVSRGRTFALVIVGLIVLQIAFAAFAAVLPLVGLFHGGNALAILVVAALAARRPIGVAHD